MKLFLTILFMLAHTTVYASGIEIGCYKIDGPANVRSTPNGKIISKLQDKAEVYASKREGEWYFIKSYDRKTCYTGMLMTGEIEVVKGWTHKNNIKNKIVVKDLCNISYHLLSNKKQMYDFHSSKQHRKSNKYGILKNNCTCAVVNEHGFALFGCNKQKYPQGSFSGTSCSTFTLSKNRKYSACLNNDMKNVFTLCPLACINEKKMVPLENGELLKIQKSIKGKDLVILRKKIGKKMFNYIENNFNEWSLNYWTNDLQYKGIVEFKLNESTIHYPSEKITAFVFMKNNQLIIVIEDNGKLIHFNLGTYSEKVFSSVLHFYHLQNNSLYFAIDTYYLGVSDAAGWVGYKVLYKDNAKWKVIDIDKETLESSKQKLTIFKQMLSKLELKIQDRRDITGSYRTRKKKVKYHRMITFQHQDHWINF